MADLYPDQLTYEQMLELVAKWYDTDAQNIVDTLNKYDVPYGDMEQLYGFIDKTPYGAMYNSDGSIRSPIYRYVTSKPTAASYNAAKNIDSNVQIAEKTRIDIPLESKIDSTTKKVVFSSGLQSVKDAAKHPLKFTFSSVVPAVAAASAGITVGKNIDKALYNLNPDFWNEKGMSSLNPDTWNGITSGDSSTGARLFNMVFGLNPDDGTSQAYMDENALAYLALYMQNLGILDSSTLSEVESGQNVNGAVINGTIYKSKTEYSKYLRSDYPDYTYTDYLAFANEERKYAWTVNIKNKPSVPGPIYFINYKYTVLVASPESVNTPAGWSEFNLLDGSFGGGGGVKVERYTYDNKTVKYWVRDDCIPIIEESSFDTEYDYGLLAWLIVYGKASEISSVEGIGTQPGATIPDLSGLTDIADALNKLKETYPNLWDNAVSQDVAQPDGTTKHYVYVPVGFPSTTGATDTQPTTGSQTQNNTKIDPKTDPQTLPEDLVKTLTRILTPTNTPNPPDTGGGDTPTVVPVTGSASSLYAIYNPTLSEINSFGAWLWSDNFIEQIKKLFSDPMQAIIGLHKVYATPVTGGAQSIKVGYLDSGVSSKIVTNQYTTIDCGTVTLDEYFFNVFDYSPYTEVSLYLPFIGIVNLDVADVMRASIHIIYHVDVLTGACLAEVKVTRDSAGGTLYQYAGNAAVTLPISSGSYMGIVASLASIAGGVAGTIASGGAAAPMLIGSAGSALNARTRVEHSGGFSGNAGAMGGKIPYLIISRPQTELAENYGVYIGNPSNHTVTLGSCSGYVQVKECHLENIPATQNELNQIESLLKGGVLL